MPAFFRYFFTIRSPLNAVVKLIESFTRRTNSIFNKIFLVQTKVLFNEVQCLWNDIGKVKESFRLHHFFPMAAKTSLRNSKSKTMALSATRDNDLSSEHLTFSSICFPDFISIFKRFEYQFLNYPPEIATNNGRLIYVNVQPQTLFRSMSKLNCHETPPAT